MIDVKINDKTYMTIQSVKIINSFIDCFNREIKEYSFIKLDNPFEDVEFRIRYKRFNNYNSWRVENMSFYNTETKKFEDVPVHIAGIMGEYLSSYLLQRGTHS